jgi:hypothetical protein
MIVNTQERIKILSALQPPTAQEMDATGKSRADIERMVSDLQTTIQRLDAIQQVTLAIGFDPTASMKDIADSIELVKLLDLHTRWACEVIAAFQSAKYGVN